MTSSYLNDLLRLADMPLIDAEKVTISGPECILPTPYPFLAPGAACIAATGLAAAKLWELKTGRSQTIQLDTYAAAAALRSPRYILIDGKKVAEDPEKITGFYQLKDGRWMYLHCNFPNVRDGNLKAIGAPANKEAVSRAIATMDGIELEKAMFANGGCGGMIRTEQEWEQLPQKINLDGQPLFEIIKIGDSPVQPMPKGDRPLSGIRMLDLTRVLAGPACARAFAEHGADVLRVTRKDLPDLGAPSDVDTGIGKLNTHIDLREAAGEKRLHELVREADVFLQAYRPGSMAARGFSPEALAAERPGIIYVTLNAWGFQGPWQNSRGYDTVVQTFNGMAWRPNNQKPAFLPGSPHDYIVGYVLAFAAMVALRKRATEGGSWMVRSSLAGSGEWFRQAPRFPSQDYASLPNEFSEEIIKRLTMQHDSPWGRVTHLAPAAQLSETPGRWERPAVPRGTHAPVWPAA